MRYKAVAFLQNAWSEKYAGIRWERHSWLKALHKSRTGQRLRVLTANCPSVQICFDNTTNVVGKHPNSIIPPDIKHIKMVLKKHHPDVIIAFGKQAELVLKSLKVQPLLILPHPVYRLVTNNIYIEAGKLLEEGLSGVINKKEKC